MIDDAHGRPGDPVCGRSTEGLFFRRDHGWPQVPEHQRRHACGAGRTPTIGGRGPHSHVDS